MNQETKEKLTATATAAKTKMASAIAWCKEKTAALWKSGGKGKAVCIGVAVAILLLLMKCCGGGEGTASLSSLLKKAETKTAETGNINFFGFYTGMPPKDAEALGKHYGLPALGEDALQIKETPVSHEVYEIRFNLKAVQSLTKGGNSFDELVQSVAFHVGPMDYRENDMYRYEAINGNKLFMRPPSYVFGNNTAKKDGGVLSLEDPALSGKANREKEELKKQEEADAWNAIRAEVEDISRDLRKKDPHRPGETKTIMLPGGAKMEMAWCPPGAFMMGSPDDEEGRSESEVEHRVTLTEGFWMAKTEVTQAQWSKVMGSLPAMKSKGENLPAANVNWIACKIFCERSGLNLPSESQWEYACRAGNTGAYGGTGRMDAMGWCSDNSEKELHPVGKKKANAWGLYDMHGNVAEWCADSAIKYSHEAVTNPPVRENGQERVIRGGAVPIGAAFCRSASWLTGDIRKEAGFIGFRPVCLDIEAQEETTRKTDRLIRELESLGRGTEAGETKTIHLFEGTPMEMVWCPPGSFTMGEGVKGSEHPVTLTSGFWLAKTEVSQAQWKDVMGFNPAESPHGGWSIDKPTGIPGDDLPVVGISWEWCRQFCLKTGLKLPTEAQWEYACGAGNWQMEKGSYGDLSYTGWYDMASSWAKVDSGSANAWGIRSMMENVAEWCADWFVYPMDKEAATDPAGPAAGEKKVARTGSDKTTVRVGLDPSKTYNNLGFRPCYPVSD